MSKMPFELYCGCQRSVCCLNLYLVVCHVRMEFVLKKVSLPKRSNDNKEGGERKSSVMSRESLDLPTLKEINACLKKHC